MRALLTAAVIALAGCAGPVDAVEGRRPTLDVGEARSVVLTAPDPGPTQRRITADQLAQLSPALRATPVVGVPLRSAGGRVGLLDHLLDAMAGLDPSALPPAAVNLVTLLCTPVSDLDWRDTRLAAIAEVSGATDAPLGQLVAELLGRPPEAPLLPRAALVDALAVGLVGSHPEALDDDTLWLRLEDLLLGLHALSHRYGARPTHPGVFGEVVDGGAGGPTAIRVRLTENPAAVPGLDLESMSAASVRRRLDDPGSLIDLDQPEWLAFEGLVFGDPVRLRAVALRWSEAAQRLEGGTAVDGGPRGDAAVWSAAPWTIERIVADAAWRAWATYRGESLWPAEAPAVRLSVADGWFETEAWGGLPAAPSPGYVWDLVLDLLAARLRDRGVPEGAGTVDIALTDVPLGITRAELVGSAQATLAANPSALVDIVLSTVGRGQGAPDIYYRPDATEGDQLHFVGPADVPRDRNNEPLRSVDYPRVGFFADAGLERPARGGDAPTMRIAALPGTQVFVGDEGGRVFAISVGEPPGVRRVALTVERLR